MSNEFAANTLTHYLAAKFATGPIRVFSHTRTLALLPRLILDCLSAPLDVFACALDGIATGKRAKEADKEECRQQRRENSFDHGESPIVRRSQ